LENTEYFPRKTKPAVSPNGCWQLALLKY